MYQALVNKDTNFEGIFFAGIKTTGIFCRPSCTARKPKPENVEYYPSTSEAIRHGYRPCKVCHPMELMDATPAWLEGLLKEIAADPAIRLRSADLRTRGLPPERVSRWFKKTHGITFQAYLRMLRINQAFGQIKYGERVTDTAFSNGYESLSGFGDSFKKTTGFAPAKSPGKNIITVTRLLTPLGPMLAGATDEGICLLEFTDRRMLETQLLRLKKYLKAEVMPGEHSLFKKLDEQLKQYFEGKRKDFDLPLNLPGTAFQQQVWAELQNIPNGKTRSYKEQAENIGNPKAVRAVAKANGDNRISIIVPCHRVIGSDGALTGYGGGLWRKKWLLEHECNLKLPLEVTASTPPAIC
ncbi:MAG: methylated-DNA--[protein]-cysteine S-methyltransferase [Saprospiraceae bacterium]|nr:methylated-DNA--[protein]-cysteine S-methyltransferase [Saprospiraceae bacterium]MCF8252700.1 methylated-DNA--[protein]-cysteine S-methyltransferase [Saprospiraceae bacterium]MCF8282924.1 methylated-DNA--[protein]-cysteine S-methyltransferase [Bacteroidales bacterium]MCF8311652.1 methylated-DNA--[protein]-cysteine S-methyltransferase [Saprospiraceae bacterium]MCF8440993.1 methylated-DNA--[protein]-cysteine S-methyltransferase [Saprospiraceae bacterium]